jgi:hypothetical protein
MAVRKTGEPADHLVFVPIAARKGALVMLLDRDDGRPLRAIRINPWE